MFEHRHHQDADGKQRSEDARRYDASRERQRRSRLGEQDHGHHADHERQRQREPVCDKHGDAEANGESYRCLVRGRHA
jgi:hypothetical protein